MLTKTILTTLAISTNASIHKTSSQDHLIWNQHALQETTPITLNIALTPKDQSVLDQTFLEITNPTHAKYNQHLTFNEIIHLTTSSETIAAVKTFLQTNCGAKPNDIQVSPARDWITATAPKTNIEECLETSFYRYTAQGHNDIIKTKQYTIPSHLENKIITIASLTRFPTLQQPNKRFTKQQPKQDLDLDSGNVTTPELLSSFYSIDLTPINNTKSTQAVYEQGQSFIKSDLSAFQKRYNIQNTPVSKIIGTANDPGK